MNDKMEYRLLGNTGLKVSCISLGNWLNAYDSESEKEIYDVMVKCKEYGINYFDTAEMYASGVGEQILGKCLKKLDWNREDYVISTKIWKCAMPSQTPGINGLGLSRKHVIEGIKASLGRLQLDYVDIIYCHRFDHETPIEEVCRAMNYVLEKGWAFYWGTSEWTAAQIMEAMDVCDKLKLIRPVVEQSLYNMFYRDKVEVDYIGLFEKYKYGISTYASLAGGILTGKYNDGNIPLDSRGATIIGANTRIFKELLSGDNKEKTLKKCVALEEIAKENGCTLAQLALAWALANKDTSTLTIGARNVNQLEENAKAIEVYKKWTPELDRICENILGTRPNPPINWKTWKKFEPRR